MPINTSVCVCVKKLISYGKNICPNPVVFTCSGRIYVFELSLLRAYVRQSSSMICRSCLQKFNVSKNHLFMQLYQTNGQLVMIMLTFTKIIHLFNIIG